MEEIYDYQWECSYLSKVSRAMAAIFLASASKMDDKPTFPPFRIGNGTNFFPWSTVPNLELPNICLIRMSTILWRDTGSQWRYSLIPPLGLVTRCKHHKGLVYHFSKAKCKQPLSFYLCSHFTFHLSYFLINILRFCRVSMIQTHTSQARTN